MASADTISPKKCRFSDCETKTFLPNRPRQKFCSTLCRMKFHNGKHNRQLSRLKRIKEIANKASGSSKRQQLLDACERLIRAKNDAPEVEIWKDADSAVVARALRDFLTREWD